MSTTSEPKAEIPPWQRIAVNGVTAAKMMGCSKSTFFQRVKDGIYPQKGVDGQWSVAALRRLHEPANESQGQRAA